MSDAQGRKLIIQIPCLNERDQLPTTLAQLPREVSGFDVVEWLVIDDGSTDGTAEVARANGVDHIVRHETNRGLARAFMSGLEASLRLGADVIVNTDADNQYAADCIPDLVEPVVSGEAQMCIGARPIGDHETFSPLKKALQKLGSWVVRKVSGAAVQDAPSGFRAISRSLAMQLYVFNRHTYTLETIIQAGLFNMPVVSVPIRVNPDMRESRLIKSMAEYVFRSAVTIVRIFVLYRPLRFFGALALLLALPGLIAFARFMLFYLQGDAGGNIQSLVIGSAFIAAGVATAVGGLVADLVAANRILLAEVRTRLFRAELELVQAEGTNDP